MIDNQLAELLAAADQCVESYIEQRRKAVSSFDSKKICCSRSTL